MHNKASQSLNRKRFRKFMPFTWLYRKFYKLLMPNRFKHMANTKPFLKLKPLAGGNWAVYWKGQYAGDTGLWSSLKKGQKRLFSIGSGPSVRDQVFDQIQENEAVLVNGAAQLVNDGRINSPLAVMIEDGRFVLERYEMLLALPKGTRLCLVASAMQALGVVAGLKGLKHFELFLIDGFETPYGKPIRPLSEASVDDYRQAGNAKLSLDLSQGHYGCGTVMYCGIQMAFYLKVQELYLVGFDLTNFNQPRFYETEQNAAWTGLQKAYESRILPAMHLTMDTAQEFGMSVYNCSPTSIIPRDLIPYSDKLEVKS